MIDPTATMINNRTKCPYCGKLRFRRLSGGRYPIYAECRCPGMRAAVQKRPWWQDILDSLVMY